MMVAKARDKGGEFSCKDEVEVTFITGIWYFSQKRGFELDKFNCIV